MNSNTKSVSVSIILRPGTLFFKGFLSYYFKSAIRKLLRIKRGPGAVLQSLVRGLCKEGIIFNINPRRENLAETVHVISNKEALKWALNLKSKGLIKRIVAGPNIAVLPTDHQSLLTDEQIDIILAPSEWVKDLYIKMCPTLASKIRVWPSGVQIPDESEIVPRDKRHTILVYKKQFNPVLAQTIIKDIEKYITEQNLSQNSLNNLPYKLKVLEYGKFKQNEYFEILKSTRALVYLQVSESQGLALQEAWARNIPTFIGDTRSYSTEGAVVDGNISAPYLTPEAGTLFDHPCSSSNTYIAQNTEGPNFIKNLEKFEQNFRSDFANFMAKVEIDTFTPRDYCIRELSDKASVDIYMNIIK